MKVHRIPHAGLVLLACLCSIITLGISASLVAWLNGHGWPSTSLKDRLRLVLTASIWTTVTLLYIMFGMWFLADDSLLIGLLVHIVIFGISFILYLPGAASLQAILSVEDCGGKDINYDPERCKMVHGLGVLAWIDVVFVFVGLVVIIILSLNAHRNQGIRRALVSEP